MFAQKYLKYKKKYLELKNLLAGMNKPEIKDRPKDGYYAEIEELSNKLIYIPQKFNLHNQILCSLSCFLRELPNFCNQLNVDNVDLNEDADIFIFEKFKKEWKGNKSKKKYLMEMINQNLQLMVDM